VFVCSNATRNLIAGSEPKLFEADVYLTKVNSMIIVMKPETPAAEIERVKEELNSGDIRTEEIIGRNRVVVALIGDTTVLDTEKIQTVSPFVEKVARIEKPFKRTSSEFRYREPSEIVVPTPNGPVTFGQNCPLVNVAGPCSVESETMIVEIAKRLKAVGVQFLRGGAYKPRTSPYSFQGHGESALDWLVAAREATGLGIITEVMDAAELDMVAQVADIVQVGARNMQNFSLLKKVGTQHRPVLLKRGQSATVEEWLMAAEYILVSGNPNVILCERGIRAFDRKYTRNTLDLSVVPVLRSLTHLPVMIDPSHGTGVAEYVPAMAIAAIAVGADALMIEVHPNPAKALSDGPQSLTLEQYEELMDQMTFVGKALSDWSEKSLTPTLQDTSDPHESTVPI
jgi:3-deoxy-7-phosphoheptulonate synthase